MKELNVNLQISLVQKCTEFMNLATSKQNPFEDPDLKSELMRIAKNIEDIHYDISLDGLKFAASKLFVMASFCVPETKTGYYPLDPKAEYFNARAAYCTPIPISKVLDPNTKDAIELGTEQLRKRKLELIKAIDPSFVPLDQVEDWPHQITPLDISLAYKLLLLNSSPSGVSRSLSVCTQLIESEQKTKAETATTGILEFLHRIHTGPESDLNTGFQPHKPDIYPSKDKVYGVVYKERRGSELSFGENMSNRTIASLASEHQIPLNQESYGRLLRSATDVGEILKGICTLPVSSFNVSVMPNTQDKVTCVMCDQKLPNIVLTTKSGVQGAPNPPISWFGGFYHYMLAHGVIPHYTFIKPLLDYIVDSQKD
jgi:hypothetical protein